MTYEIQIAPQAAEDLQEIDDYIANDLDNPQAADDTIRHILDSIAKLALFPLSGAMLKFNYAPVEGYRFVISKNYMTFYRFRDDVVYVDRILYAKSDYLHTLIEEPDLEN